MKFQVVKLSELPSRNVVLAATCRLDFDFIARSFNATPERGRAKERLLSRKEYKYICLILPSGRVAILMGGDWARGLVEISLELHDGNFFYDEDRLQIAQAIGVEQEYFQKIGGGYQWIE